MMNVFRAVIFACVIGMVHGQTDCDIKLYQRFASNQYFADNFGNVCGYPNTTKFIRSVISTAPDWVNENIIETDSTMLSKERCQHRCYEESDCDYFFYQIYFGTHNCYLIKEYAVSSCNDGNYQPNFGEQNAIAPDNSGNIINQATGEGCENLNTCLEGQYGTTGNCIDCADGTIAFTHSGDYISFTGSTQCYTPSEMFTALGAGVSKQDIIDLYTDVHGTCG